ncbi:MAG: hypothetical protein OHK0039_46790 [Bacteroidia bacterium]
MLLSVLHLPAQNFSGGFSFYLPPDDSSTQLFLPAFPARTIDQFVRIDSQGHFATDDGPIRFWGVNVTTGGNFPEKSQAPHVAARMRKFGINLVRFHHMDNPWSDVNGSLFPPNPTTTRTLSSLTLDRLHYFLAQLKAEAVYANLNLHVSRTFRPGDGVLHADSIGEFGKAVTIFDGQLIALQKEFATQLLTAPNPYTGLAPVDDPVVAMVEITNENGLYGYWKDGWLKPLARGGRLIQRHADSLDQRWQAFLQGKYSSQQALEAAWNPGTTTGGNEQIAGGGFEQGGSLPASWALEQHNGAAATVSIDPANPYSGQYAARIHVTQVTGTDWHLQFKHVGGSIAAGQRYSLRFAARAAQAADLAVAIMRDGAPYTWYTGSSFALGTSWQTYQYTFIAPETNNGEVRISFSFNNQTTQFWLDDVSLADPTVSSLLPGESLAGGTVRRIDYGECLNFTPGRYSDMAAFYLELQRAYFADMYHFLRDSLGVRVPITGSNAWGGPGDVYTQADMDYIDDHAYWDHPWFPGEPWSSTNWQISNTPMVRSAGGGTVQGIFGGLARQGKPYTISEYRHAFPNRYEVEMMPWMLAYSSLHDADGIMFFDYSGSYDDWSTDRVDSYFTLHRHGLHMALSPVYGYAFRQRLVAADTAPAVVQYPVPYLYGLPGEDDQGRWGRYFPYDARAGLVGAVRTGDYLASGAPDWSAVPAAPGNALTTTTGETRVDFDKGVLTTAAAGFASVCGDLGQASGQPAGDLRVLQGSDFGSVAWLSLGEAPLDHAERSLLTIGTKLQNTGMVWSGTQTVGNNWGYAPTLLAPITLRIELHLAAGSLRLYPLDETGAASSYTTHYPVGPARFVLDIRLQDHATLWFGIEAADIGTSLGEALADAGTLTVAPNPATTTARIALQQRQPSAAQLRIVDAQGRQVYAAAYPRSELAVWEVPTASWSRGVYYVLVAHAQGQQRSVLVLE